MILLKKFDEFNNGKELKKKKNTIWWNETRRSEKWH